MPATSAKTDTRPNILWIVAEDISPFFGCYGNADADTPNIDRLARKSHVFLNAWSTAPICAPSRSCLATGIFATSLGTQNLRSEVEIPKSVRPLASVLREHGYWTALRNKTDYNFDPTGIYEFWEDTLTPWDHCPEGKPFFAFLNLGSTHEGSGNISDRAAPALARLPEDRFHDPDKVALPPYYPDTPEMRRIWARYHDLISVWDQDVQGVLDQLKKAGKADDTIVFLMADHGLGMPRYKRWLYRTGLHVPLIIHVPEKFLDLAPGGLQSGRHANTVSFVDLPPTVLALAGIEPPDNYQGKSLFVPGSAKSRAQGLVFGARDRADDMYDLSRCVSDGRYLYIRHFMPHLPPIQEGIIFGPQEKESLRELRRVHEAGEDTAISELLWSPRPFEELYDLETDPQELHNRADDPTLADRKRDLSARLREWILETHDTAFLPEPEMHRRAKAAGLTPFEMAQSRDLYPLDAILSVAEAASRQASVDPVAFKHSDPAIRYWALMSEIIRGGRGDETLARLETGAADPEPMVRATAAEALGRIGRADLAVPVFRKLLEETEPNLALSVARALALSLDDVRPLEQDIRAKRQSFLAPPGSRRPWKDFMYSAFTCWALEWSLIKSGLADYDDF